VRPFAGTAPGLAGADFGLFSDASGETVAAALDGDDFGAVEEAVEDGPGGGDVAEQFAPFVDGAVGGHDGGADFVAAQDDFEQKFAAAGGQGFEAHVVDDEEAGFEVAGEEAAFCGASFAGGEVAHEVEDGAVVDGVAVADGFAPEGLGEVAFADAGRANEEDVAGFGDEVAGGELMDTLARDAGIEAEVEAVEGARFAEVGAFEPAGAGAAFAHGEFVLEEEFEELVVGEAVGGGFEEAGFEGFGEASETELAGVGFEGGDLAHDALVVVAISVRETGVMAGAGAVDDPAIVVSAAAAAVAVAFVGFANVGSGAGGFGSGGKRLSPPGVWWRMKSV